MKITTKMPKKGQFVMIWKYNGRTWSETLRHKDGKLMKYGLSIDNLWSQRKALVSEDITDMKYIKL